MMTGWAVGLDPNVASPARAYDYLLSGRDHHPADRQLAAQFLAQYPGARDAARENRRFVERAVCYLADRGVDQFVDIGAGMPVPASVHSIARRIVPDARVVYVDNDPTVLSYTAAALEGAEHAAAVVRGDVRDPAGILGHPDLQRMIDFRRPVGLLLCAVLTYVPACDDPCKSVATLAAAVPPGSYVVVSHAARDTPGGGFPPADPQVRSEVPQHGGRSRDEVLRFFDGLELLDPGLVPASQWWPAFRRRDVLRYAVHAGVARTRNGERLV